MKIEFWSFHTFQDYGLCRIRCRAEGKNGKVLWLSTGGQPGAAAYSGAAHDVARAFARGGRVGAILEMETMRALPFIPSTFKVLED